MDSCCKRESLETIVENAIQLSSTDIHLQCGQPIYLRHGDGLRATSFMCTTELIEDILRRCGIASYEWQSLDEACSCCGVRIRVIYIELIRPYVVHCDYFVISNLS